MRILASLAVTTFFVLLISARLEVVAQSAPKLTPAGEGRRAYLRYNCYGCHGMRGGGGMGPNIARGEAEDLGEAVMEGKGGGMPSYRGIVSSTDISNLSAYLSSIGTPNEPTFNDWWVLAPTK